MKNLIFILSLVFSFISCHKDKEIENSLVIGTFTLYQGVESWFGNVLDTGIGNEIGYINIRLSRSNSDKIDVSESLTFFNVPLEIGKHFIDTLIYYPANNQLGARYATTIDGDATGDRFYSPSANSENYLVVESYDTTTRELKASFQVFLVVDPRGSKFDPSLPDTLRFTGGKISMILKN